MTDPMKETVLMTAEEGRRIYAEMRATPVINAIGNRTFLGGSAPSVSVRQAMEAANRYYVDMGELLESTGEVIAQLLGCEAALVTPGCAAALLLGTAGCMTGDDEEKMGRLPDAAGMKSKVLIQKAQRYKYDRVVRMAGTTLVEVGGDSGATADQLAAAMGADTLAVLYPALGLPEGDTLSLEETIRVAHQSDVPVIVDAAYQVYPVEGLRRYTDMGADLVGYGAKYIGAPNSSGILCGRADLVRAARLHSFASFEILEVPGLGRPLKIDRQEVVAVVVALREWLEMDHRTRYEEASCRGRRLRRALRVRTPDIQLEPSAEDAQVVNLTVRVNSEALGKDGNAVAAQLRQGIPSIWAESAGDAVWFSMHTVADGDEHIIAERLSEILNSAQ